MTTVITYSEISTFSATTICSLDVKRISKKDILEGICMSIDFFSSRHFDTN